MLAKCSVKFGRLFGNCVPMRQSSFHPIFRFTREQYWQLSEMGFFVGKRVELIQGRIIEMAAQGNKDLRARLSLREFERLRKA